MLAAPAYDAKGEIGKEGRMSEAIMCNRCGKTEKGSETPKGWGWIDAFRQGESAFYIDLCADCFKALREWAHISNKKESA